MGHLIALQLLGFGRLLVFPRRLSARFPFYEVTEGRLVQKVWLVVQKVLAGDIRNWHQDTTEAEGVTFS